MQHYQCKCGKTKASGSMPPYKCDWCEDCNSSIALGPKAHRDRIPHKYIETKVKIDGGYGVLTKCEYCLITKDKLEG